ncbi:MAG: recombinase family protein [Acidobacteria bacterium]|nr:recombinase family protein [Acidobacteriota bacterium]
MKRAVAFVRLSGAGKTRYGETLVFDQNQNIQAEALRGFATHCGRGLARTYRDHAISSRVRWPQFDALRSDARHGGFNVVVVDQSGQIIRSLRDLPEKLDEFTRLGTGVVALADGIDTTDAITRDTAHAMVIGLLRAERTVRNECSSAALAYTRATGTRSGRPLDRPRLQIDRDQIRALRDQGRPYSQPADEPVRHRHEVTA